MKKLSLILALTIIVGLSACGGGGGGGDGDSGTDPQITTAFVFDYWDPSETPIMSAYLGDWVVVYFCFTDPDLDANKVIASQYFPPDAATPYYPVETATFGPQTQADECYYWGIFEIIGPRGLWLLRLEIKDKKGNLSLPYDIEPFEAL